MTGRRGAAAAGALLALLALNACAGGSDPLDRLRAVAKPGEIVAAELAMARAIREEGPLEGARDFAAPDLDAAQVTAAATSVASTQPRLILASCDGTLSVARGEWQGADGTAGTYSTVWRRQPSGKYRWVAREFHAGVASADADEFIATHVASCDNLAAIPPVGIEATRGVAGDGTLRWQPVPVAGGASRISVELWNGTAFERAGQP